MAVDPHWSSVVLRLPFDAAQPEGQLHDYSNSARVMTANGTNVSVAGKFNEGRGRVGGASASSHISTPRSADFAFAGDFTIECWFQSPIAGAVTAGIMGYGTNSGVGQRSWRLRYDGSQFSFLAGSGSENALTANPGASGAWRHICVDRSGSVTRLYVDGVMLASTSAIVGPLNNPTTAGTMDVGGFWGGFSVVNTRVDDVRITNGVARYASDAGFAVPTEAYPIDGSTGPIEGAGAVPGTVWVPPTGTGTVPVLAAGPVPGWRWTAPEGDGEGIQKAAYLSQLANAVLVDASPEARVSQLANSALTRQLIDAEVTQFSGAALANVFINSRVTQMALMVLAKGKEPPLMPNPLVKSDGGQSHIVDLRMVNMYIEKTPDGPTADARFGRPGLTKVAEMGPGPVRATFLHKGFRYTVSGNTVWRDAVYIGEVPSEGNLRWAISDEEIVVVAGRRAYYVTLHDVSRINDPDLPYVKDVKFLAGRFIYFDDDTSGFYRYSELNNARKVDGLAFASAELNPDPIVGAEIQGELVAIFGTLTTEWHYPTTNPANPFKRSAGRTYDKGCLAIQTVQKADNSLIFVGHDRTVYRAGSGPTRVSDHDVENALRKQSADEFASNSAFKLAFGGHIFYVLNIVGQGTWAYDIGYDSWAEWKSWGMNRFRVSVSDEEGFLGDAISGTIFGVDGKKYQDVDEPIERVISTFMPLASGTLKNFNLALHTVQGVGLMPHGYGEDPVVEMRFSDHAGLDFTAWMEAPLGRHQVRGRESLAMWTSLGAFNHPGRVFEFRCTDPVEFSPYSASFNEARL